MIKNQVGVIARKARNVGKSLGMFRMCVRYSGMLAVCGVVDIVAALANSPRLEKGVAQTRLILQKAVFEFSPC